MKRFKDILCVVDTGQDCKTALERAVSLAENNQACLTIVEVVKDIPVGIPLPRSAPITAEMQKAFLSRHEQDLKTLVNPFCDRLEIQTKVLMGTAFLEIIREVLRNRRDLVIKAPETEDWLDRLFGGDDMHLLRKCPCPTWIIKPTPAKSNQVILAAVDVDSVHPAEELEPRHALNRQILEMASSLALVDFAELHIVQAWHAPGENMMSGSLMRTPQKEVTAYVNQVERKYTADLAALMKEITGTLGQETLDYLRPQTHLVKGFARKEIPALAKRIEADLVVMGTVGRTGIPGFIVGNTAEMILGQLDCSVLAIKPPGFKTPVTAED